MTQRPTIQGLLTFGMVLTLVGLVAVPAAAVPGPEPGSHNFAIIFNNLDEHALVDEIDFHTASGWDFGDRGAYSCAWVEHFTDGALDFIMTFDRVLGVDYMQVNDRYGVESSNDCGSADDGEAVFDGSDHFPHGTTLTFSRDGQVFESLDMFRGCDSGYYTPGDEPGEAWLWWDPDGPQETEHGLGNCNGGPEEPEAVIRIQVVSGAEGVSVCTADRMDGDVCGAPGSGSPNHTSAITLELSGRLKASGSVRSLDGTAACERGRKVSIQRRASGRWKTVGRDRTSNTGHYADQIQHRDGLYRARVSAATLANGDTCREAVSGKRSFHATAGASPDTTINTSLSFFCENRAALAPP
jgi:hypothetical protein